jgi:hypothetical protein
MLAVMIILLMIILLMVALPMGVLMTDWLDRSGSALDIAELVEHEQRMIAGLNRFCQRFHVVSGGECGFRCCCPPAP